LAGYEGPGGAGFLCPVIGPDGWFGTIVFTKLDLFPLSLERELTLAATQLSLWCVDHAVGAVPDQRTDNQLGPRQYAVARLAAEGRTNGEIADALNISINTVKNHLKHVFLRLGIANRTELANMLRRLAPILDVPEGVTHLPTVVVTRAPTPNAPAAGRRRPPASQDG